VPDPYGYPEAEFEKVFDLIDAACEVIIEKYA
jgi:protein-tyrosine-phosphatase